MGKKWKKNEIMKEKKTKNETNCKLEDRQWMCKTIRDYETKFGEI